MITLDGLRTGILWAAIFVWLLCVIYYAKAAPFWKSLEGIHIFLEMLIFEIILLYLGLRINNNIRHSAAVAIGGAIYLSMLLIAIWRLFLMIRANRPFIKRPNFNVIGTATAKKEQEMEDIDE
jgi:hypothetical protein